MTASPRANLPRRSIRADRHKLVPHSFSSLCSNHMRYKETRSIKNCQFGFITNLSLLLFHSLSLSLLIFHSVEYCSVEYSKLLDTFNATSPATLALIKTKTDTAISTPGSRFLFLPSHLSFYPSILCRSIRLSLAYSR